MSDLISLLLFSPIFFFYFRMLAFETVPIDDYYNFILKMDRKIEFEFYSPQGYRWLYFGTSYLLYKISPLIELTNITTVDVSKLKAIQALSLVSFFGTHLIFFINYLLVSKFFKTSKPLALLTATAIFFISLHSNIYSIDAFSIAYISLLVLLIDKFPVFSLLLVVSILANEKIPLLFMGYFATMALTDGLKPDIVKRLALSIFAVLIYFGERAYFNFSGYEYQTQPSLFWERMVMSIPYLFSLKGFYMNFLHLLILLAIGVLSYRGKILRPGLYFSKSIVLQPILLFILGMFACSNYGIGRVALHCLPLFTIPLAFLLKGFFFSDLGDPMKISNSTTLPIT